MSERLATLYQITQQAFDVAIVPVWKAVKDPPLSDTNTSKKETPEPGAPFRRSEPINLTVSKGAPPAAGDVPGTLAYISPERLQGLAATPAADSWAGGVVLFEALAGELPFWGGDLVETSRRIQAGAPDLATLRPDLPRTGRRRPPR